jgi:Periplasmic binding protein
MIKRAILVGLLATDLILASGQAFAAGQYGPGVSDTEIKIGQTMPYSGPASSYGTIGKSEAAYFAMINDQGGINGRKINFISRDDGYSPPKTVEVTRQLVEQDHVLLPFQTLGTPPNIAIQGYLNENKVPHPPPLADRQLKARLRNYYAEGLSPVARHPLADWDSRLLNASKARGSVIGELIDRAAILTAFEQVGGAQACLDMAKAYATARPSARLRWT